MKIGRPLAIAQIAIAFIVFFGCEHVYYNLCRGADAKSDCARIETTSSCTIVRINGGEVREGHIIIDVPAGKVKLIPRWTAGEWETTSRDEVTYELRPGHSYLLGVETGSAAPGPAEETNAAPNIRFYLKDKDTGEKLYGLPSP